MQNVIGALEDGLTVSYKLVGVLMTLTPRLALHPVRAHAMTAPSARPLGG